MSDQALLSLREVRFGYDREEEFLGPVSVELRAGGLLTVVGPNGAGKSTLLRLMNGLLTPAGGTIEVTGRRLESLGGRRRATLMAFMAQHNSAPPDLVVRDVVLLGRYPHRRWGFFDTPEDHRIAAASMATTDTGRFADRTLATISAGEQQRVHLAAALAQQPRLLLLDEPTSALDPYHQLSIFGVLRELCNRGDAGVVVATHDLNLAGQYADQILLLSEGKVAGAGPAEEVLRAERLERVYGVSFRTFRAEGDSRGWVFAVAAEEGRR